VSQKRHIHMGPIRNGSRILSFLSEGKGVP
jgi:hypothetical protein